MRRTRRSAVLVGGMTTVATLTLAFASCKKSEEPDAVKAPDAAPATTSTSTPLPSPSERFAAALRDGGFQIKPHDGKLQKDDAGHYIPTTPRPSDDPRDIPPAPSREPDADLDLDDPARDYVGRYIKGTNRYGDKTGCVVVGNSTEASPPRRLVEVRDNKDDPKCGGGDALRDAFVVDVGADRMSKKDPKLGERLKPWPDGSDPEAPAKPSISIDDLRNQWKTPLYEAIKALKLTPIRVQVYGRGTYPVITLAGFREPLTRDTRPTDMQEGLNRLCAASMGIPMSFLGGIDRSTTLRVRCANPPSARWDRF